MKERNCQGNLKKKLKHIAGACFGLLTVGRKGEPRRKNAVGAVVAGARGIYFLPPKMR